LFRQREAFFIRVNFYVQEVDMRRRAIIAVCCAFALLALGAGSAFADEPESPEPYIKYVRYVVRHGDTLSKIARAYHTTVYAIASANGISWRVDWIYPGEILVVPVYGYYPPPGRKHPSSPPWYAPRPLPPRYGRCGYGYSCYIVRRGDTLLNIARRYGVDVWALARANGIYNLNRIYAGMPLTIPRR
jgi:LysM repeat protein